MRIDKIEIDNYRRFEHFECAFDTHFTLLMGPNGSGKTSLLQAIYAGVGLLFDKVIPDEDVRRTNAIDPGDSSWRVPVYPCSIQCSLQVQEQRFTVGNSRNATLGVTIPILDSTEPEFHRAYNSLRGLRTQWMDPTFTDQVPLIARFGAADSFGGTGRPERVRQPFENKQQVWDLAAFASINVQLLAQWFQYNELRTLQEGKTPIAYSAAREAVLSAIHAVDIKYVVRDNQLMVHHSDQGWRPWEQLSDGQKRIAAIFCELALRCSALNSHLAERCIVDSPGIVLIDELDLHLHPLWQRSVIGDLRRVFPSLQFIVASHSPFLLQAAFEHGQVVDMRSGHFVQAGDTSIEDIAESVMGVPQPQRGKRFLDLKATAARYIRLLESPPTDADELARLKAELDGHMANFANDPASAAWLEQQRHAAGL